MDVNNVRKSLGWVVCSREAKSDMMLNNPDKWSMAGRAACRCCNCMASARSIRDAHFDELFRIL